MRTGVVLLGGMMADAKQKTKVQEPLRERILKRALIEFGDKGYEGARMEEICKAVGASKQVIYHHFQSKEKLFETVLRQAYLDFRGNDEALEKRIAGMDAEAALREFVEFLFKPSEDTIRFQRLVQDENWFEARHTVEFTEARAAFARLIKIMSKILEQGVAEGVFRDNIDPSELYISLAGQFIFRITNAHTLASMLGVKLNTPVGARRSRKVAVQLILDSIRPHKT
jgi:TetR/AcrR family transcriptional regulator